MIKWSHKMGMSQDMTYWVFSFGGGVPDFETRPTGVVNWLVVSESAAITTTSWYQQKTQQISENTLTNLGHWLSEVKSNIHNIFYWCFPVLSGHFQVDVFVIFLLCHLFVIFLALLTEMSCTFWAAKSAGCWHRISGESGSPWVGFGVLPYHPWDCYIYLHLHNGFWW